MELETKIHELLARRAERRREEFLSDASHMKDATRHSPSAFRPKEVLGDAKAITSRRGFLHEQLRIESLTQLKRWHVQLQLLEMDDRTSSHASELHVDHEDIASGNPQSPLERSLAAIQRDRMCFDISYVASSTRIADLKETLFDASDKSLQRVSEALAFSSTIIGYTTRVVLFRVDNSRSTRVRSSLFVSGLQDQVDQLTEGSDTDGGIQLILDSLWR